MKKLISILSIFVLATALLSAQVLSKQGVQNTASVSMGEPYDYVDNSNRDTFKFYGAVDVLQIRVDISKFTIEGMLNWGALFHDDGFTFANTGETPYVYSNAWRGNPHEWREMYKSYYVNFLLRPTKNFDIGMGTMLNWNIGPAPSHNGMAWEPKTHLAQGGLAEGAPGSAEVVGYIHYANCYAREAIAARFKNDMIEVGVAIPDGATTNDFRSNVAFGIKPFDWLYAGAAVEISFGHESNFYTGLELTVNKNFIVDAYLAIDNVGGAKDNLLWGTGAAVTYKVPKINFSIKPEVGFTFYKYSEYTFAFFGGARAELGFNAFTFGLWSSLAFGAEDKRWPDNYTRGFIFDMRPDVTYQINKNNSVSAMFDIQYCKSFTDVKQNTWATSVYWTYKM